MRIPLRFSQRWGWLLMPAGITAANSYVEVDRDEGSFRVRMGPWFDETFRLDEVTEVVPSSFPWYGGLGVKLGPGDAVSVVAAQDRIALVRFRRPRTMHVLVAVQRSGLRLSVDDVDGLRAALTSRS